MRVSVNLIGILQEYYPDAIETFGEAVTHEAPPGTTVMELIAAIGVPNEEEYFIMVNGERVDHASASARELEAEDTVVLVPVIKGG